MKVSIHDIPDEGISLDIEDGCSALDLTFLEPARGGLDIRLHKKEVIVSGSITARLSLNCARCLKDYSFKVDTNVSIYALTEVGEGDDGDDVEGPEGAHIKDGEIDVSGILSEYIALEIPMKQVCSEECKGLCAKCGADRNLSPCGCAVEKAVDPRFTKLKDFKTKK